MFVSPWISTTSVLRKWRVHWTESPPDPTALIFMRDSDICLGQFSTSQDVFYHLGLSVYLDIVVITSLKARAMVHRKYPEG
ncbi:hypothetical protein L207DRAFT_507437 [Hyaloscypha variabilis F]|uniref:Uncharacterized protein n=1 Tax=Hyaloscypha variabilis (strain UAMH 11265 / GT02V1 / F) TaxID=1149755 RepID=A0A2J6S6Z5_HYAVF|nr:hypothetical protein L207DRAFT_507437 [Hyaloscypha variabilis F]